MPDARERARVLPEGNTTRGTGGGTSPGSHRKYPQGNPGDEKQVEALTDLTERIFSKCNANTKQLEDVKVHVRALAKTDYDRACEFLQDALSGGRLNGNDLLLQADEAGIKRSEIMKAKKDLGVQIDISGYGKNQKAWWYIPA